MPLAGIPATDFIHLLKIYLVKNKWIKNLKFKNWHPSEFRGVEKIRSGKILPNTFLTSLLW